jgi:hypothetical protein
MLKPIGHFKQKLLEKIITLVVRGTEEGRGIRIKSSSRPTLGLADPDDFFQSW